MKICIDPGHGGNDSGAVGPTELEEADVVLKISEYLAKDLATYHDVVTKLTRSTDVFVELGQRCAIANDWNADYFVSIHLNSNGETANGIETLYVSSIGKAIAEKVQKQLVAATGDRDRGVIYRDDLYVLNGTNMPAILAEGGFISNPTYESKFKTEEYRQLVAIAICEGLMSYIRGEHV